MQSTSTCGGSVMSLVTLTSLTLFTGLSKCKDKQARAKFSPNKEAEQTILTGTNTSNTRHKKWTLLFVNTAQCQGQTGKLESGFVLYRAWFLKLWYVYHYWYANHSLLVCSLNNKNQKQKRIKNNTQATYI